MNNLNLRMVDPDIDAEAMEITFSAASSEPYERYGYVEVLECGPENINLDRLNGGASVLRNHDDDHILGKVVRAWTEDGKLYIRARFRKNQNEAKTVFSDIVDGTLQNVSVGYVQDDWREEKDESGKITRYVTRWTCYEVSVAVGVPADPTVGFYRKIELKNTNETGETPMTEEVKEVPAAEEAAEKELEAVKAELEEIKSELETIKNTMTEEVKEEAADDGAAEAEAEPVAEERKVSAMDKEIRSLNVRAAEPVATRNESQVAMYTKAFQEALGIVSGTEARKVSDQLYKDAGLTVKSGNSIMLHTRDFDGTNGGGLIGTDHLADQFVYQLKTKMALKNATILSGLVGNVSIPAQTGKSTVTTPSSINGAATATSPTVGAITLTPTKYTGMVAIGKDLIAQGNPDAIQFVINDLSAQIARSLEAAAYTALASATGVQTATFTDIDAPTWAEAVGIIGQVEGYELFGDLSWIMTAGQKGVFKKAPKASGWGSFICEDGLIDGYMVDVSQQVPAGKVFFGAFSNVIIGQWGGLEVLVDPYTLAANGEVRVVATLLAAVGVRNPEGFVVAAEAVSGGGSTGS